MALSERGGSCELGQADGLPGEKPGEGLQAGGLGNEAGQWSGETQDAQAWRRLQSPAEGGESTAEAGCLPWLLLQRCEKWSTANEKRLRAESDSSLLESLFPLLSSCVTWATHLIAANFGFLMCEQGHNFFTIDYPLGLSEKM